MATALVITLAGCSSSSNSGGTTPATPTVTSASPASGTVGTAVTVAGSNFGATQAAGSTVTFAGPANSTVAATVISWSSTSIVTNVPTGAVTGNIVITVGGAASNGETFTVGTSTAAACGTGSESALTGSFAYHMAGFSGAGVGTHFARVGSFTASGAGHITAGEEDFNAGTSGDVHHTIAATSTYSIGPDFRGCLTLNYSDTTSATFRFSVGDFSSSVATRGHIIEFDNSGNRAAGVILPQTASAFTGNGSQFDANYAFGIAGIDSTGGHVAEAGTFTLAPMAATSNISNGYLDLNDAGATPFGTTGTAGSSTGTFATSAGITANGRTTATFIAETPCAATCTYNWAVYFINAHEFFIISKDTLGVNTPLVSGRAAETSATFNTASTVLQTQDDYILGASGIIGGLAVSQLAQVQFNNPSTYNSFTWTYGRGTGVIITPPATPVALTGGAYAVSAVGRATMTNAKLAIYLATPAASGITGFVVSTDNSTTAAYEGFLIAQPSGATLQAGQYIFGTNSAPDNFVGDVAGSAGVTVSSSGVDTIGGAYDQNSEALGLATLAFSNVSFTLGGTGFAPGMGIATDTSGDTFVAVGGNTFIYYIEENTTLGIPAEIVFAEQ